MGFILDEHPIRANEPIVVGETIDGESIIMHHRTGHYFSAVGSGSVIWAMVQGTTTVDALVARLVEAYEITPGEVLPVILGFLETLADHDLIVRAPADAVVAPAKSMPSAPRRRDAFVEPVLDVHTELEDVLLLDPIHDVDEYGWPKPVAKGSVTAAQ